MRIHWFLFNLPLFWRFSHGYWNRKDLLSGKVFTKYDVSFWISVQGKMRQQFPCDMLFSFRMYSGYKILQVIVIEITMATIYLCHEMLYCKSYLVISSHMECSSLARKIRYPVLSCDVLSIVVRVLWCILRPDFLVVSVRECETQMCVHMERDFDTSQVVFEWCDVMWCVFILDFLMGEVKVIWMDQNWDNY